MSKYGIVVIGYNRLDSIQRLMESLLNAKYDEPVDLIISIDNSGTDTVEKFAKIIEWPHGTKIIKTFPERLGLKKHVITCGGYINEYHYEAIIVLEDDLFVAPNFFNFSIQAVNNYADNEQIAGISLYSHFRNIDADRPFYPVYKGYDIFFMQYAQSWGQIWMKQQWNAFYDWYTSKKYESLDEGKIPKNVVGWPETSWLKYHIEYCIDTGKYFAYPYHSLTTNYADAGTHYAFSTNKMQVPLDMSKRKKYTFPQTIDETSVYDSYYESMQLATVLGLQTDTLEVDLFGRKKKYAPNIKFVLSTGRKKFKVIKKFGLQMRPWELNVVYQVPGQEIFLYDLSQIDQPPLQKHSSLVHWIYDTKGEVILKRNFIAIIVHEIFNKVRKK